MYFFVSLSTPVCMKIRFYPFYSKILSSSAKNFTNSHFYQLPLLSEAWKKGVNNKLFIMQPVTCYLHWKWRAAKFLQEHKLRIYSGNMVMFVKRIDQWTSRVDSAVYGCVSSNHCFQIELPKKLLKKKATFFHIK